MTANLMNNSKMDLFKKLIYDELKKIKIFFLFIYLLFFFNYYYLFEFMVVKINFINNFFYILNKK